MKKISLASIIILIAFHSHAQESKIDSSKTIFTFSGFVKFDLMITNYRDGEPGPESPIKDINLPGAIPVGSNLEGFDTHFHVKESRFNFGIDSEVLGRPIKAFMEMDFLLSQAGG